MLLYARWPQAFGAALLFYLYIALDLCSIHAACAPFSSGQKHIHPVSRFCSIYLYAWVSLIELVFRFQSKHLASEDLCPSYMAMLAVAGDELT